jgi:predicted Zn-dependent peptidase
MKNKIALMNNKAFQLIALFLLLTIAGLAQVDRSKQPAPAPAKTVNVADSKSFTLDNGLQVIVVEDHKQPMVSFSLLVDADPVLEKEQSGYVSMVGSLLRTATTTKTKDQIDKEIDQLGANLNFSASGFYATSLKKHTEKLLGIVSDVLLNPVFKQDELDKLKKQAISNIASSKDEPNAIARKVFNEVAYGEGHPYAEFETEESIDKITLEKCNDYFKTYYRPNVSYLSIVGDISYSEAQKLAKAYFGKWEKAVVPTHTYPTPEAPLVNKVVLVDRANSVQSVLEVGYPIIFKLDAPDYIQARVMNTILGGGVFRLFENLREKHAFTYGAYSNLQNDKLIALFTASASVRNEVTDSSLTEIFYELKRIRTEPVGEVELNKAKNYLSGSFAIQLESPQTIANFATNIARFGLSKDFYKTYLTRLAAITSAQIQEAAKKYILPDQAYILVVGKQAEVLDRVKKFSVSGKIDFYDVDGKKIDPNAASVPVGISVDQIIDKYTAAVGGKEKVLSVKDLTTSITMAVQGMELSATIYQKAPDKFLMKLSIPGMEQKTLFDGQKGGTYSSMGNKELEAKEIPDAKYRYNLNNMLNYKSLNVTAKLGDLKKINDKDAYRVEFKLPSGSSIVDYFDVESGLRVREETDLNTPQGSFTQVVDMSDYRDINGVKYPFVIKTSVAGQTIEAKVTKIEVNTGIEDSLFIQ